MQDELKKAPIPDFTKGLHGAGALKPANNHQTQQPSKPNGNGSGQQKRGNSNE